MLEIKVFSSTREAQLSSCYTSHFHKNVVFEKRSLLLKKKDKSKLLG